MSDNHRRYRSIKAALKQMVPGAKGHAEKHLNTLAALISGIVGSRRTNYPAIAGKVPDAAKPESRVKRFSRWVNDVDKDVAIQVIPFARDLLAGLSEHTLVLIMDGSEVGRKCLALMVSVVYKGRALPIAWLVVKGSKGHFPEDSHIKLIEKVHALLPERADIVFLGDGEFDGCALQHQLDQYHWEYVCRTASNAILYDLSEEISFKRLSVFPGDQLSLPQIFFTRQQYGPLQAIVWWRKDCKEPLFLVTNMDLMEEACHWYQKRFHIETFFSDQKSRGFNLHKSHLAFPERVGRLMIATCLAYVWIIYLGALTLKEGWNRIVHRTDRCDLSLFQLGLRTLDWLVDQHRPIPVSFLLL